MQSVTERAELLNKMVAKAMSALKEVHNLSTSVMCFAPDEETRKELEVGMRMVEKAMKKTAAYHAKTRRDLLRNR
jgi:hypothetical protein